MLTLMATGGGIVIGTLLALARLSDIRPFPCRGRLREPDPLDAARSGDLLVLLLGTYIGQWITGASRPFRSAHSFRRW
jgi:hypothetical protein